MYLGGTRGEVLVGAIAQDHAVAVGIFRAFATFFHRYKADDGHAEFRFEHGEDLWLLLPEFV